MLHCWGTQALAWVVRFSFLSILFDRIGQDQFALRLCWQWQVFQGSPPLCITQGLWNENTLDRWTVSPPASHSHLPSCLHCQASAACQCWGGLTTLWNGDASGTWHSKQCRFIAPSKLLQGWVQLHLKERKDFSLVWSWPVRFNLL